MKIIWGLLIATISWIMISFAGIDGIKMTSNLGGFPALFIILIVALGLLRFMLNPKLVERD
jgi:choline-glycine betaine transporter